MAKQKKCRKKTQAEIDAVEAAYNLGVQNGEQKLERTLILLQTTNEQLWEQLSRKLGQKQTLMLLRTTNRQLWDELCRLDREDPVTGVVVPEVRVKQIVRALRKRTTNYPLATKLKNLPKPDVKIIHHISV